jgi:hypothetical protein
LLAFIIHHLHPDSQNLNDSFTCGLGENLNLTIFEIRFQLREIEIGRALYLSSIGYSVIYLEEELIGLDLGVVL